MPSIVLIVDCSSSSRVPQITAQSAQLNINHFLCPIIRVLPTVPTQRRPSLLPTNTKASEMKSTRDPNVCHAVDPIHMQAGSRYPDRFKSCGVRHRQRRREHRTFLKKSLRFPPLSRHFFPCLTIPGSYCTTLYSHISRYFKVHESNHKAVKPERSRG